jgi:hypothetical protein
LQAVPRSLATTCGISVDLFSSGYLDVSVLRVRSTQAMYSLGSSLAGGFPHSDIYGSMLYCQLPVAFRRLTRLSSPVIAKASIICTYSLDPITLSPQSSLIKDRYKCIRLASVTSSVRLEQIRFDTIKTHLDFQHSLPQVSPCPRLRESLSLLLPNF